MLNQQGKLCYQTESTIDRGSRPNRAIKLEISETICLSQTRLIQHVRGHCFGGRFSCDRERDIKKTFWRACHHRPLPPTSLSLFLSLILNYSYLGRGISMFYRCHGCCVAQLSVLNICFSLLLLLYRSWGPQLRQTVFMKILRWSPKISILGEDTQRDENKQRIKCNTRLMRMRSELKSEKITTFLHVIGYTV